MAKIEIFSSPGCQYCDCAKALLDGKGLAYTELDISADPATRRDFVHRLPRTKSIPQIFIDGSHIGGYEDLCLLDEGGQVDRMAETAPPR